MGNQWLQFTVWPPVGGLGDPVKSMYVYESTATHPCMYICIYPVQQVSVLVVFPSLVCVVEGWSVCEAVGHAVGARDRWEAEEEEVEEVPVISYRKWRLGDQRGTTDAALLGTHTHHHHLHHIHIHDVHCSSLYSMSL